MPKKILKYIIGSVAILALLLPVVALPQTAFAATVITFTSSTTWTAPQGVTSIQIEVRGAGGSGSTTGGGSSSPSGGGGGGGYSKKNVFTVVPGTVYTVTVGVGGVAVVGSALNGNAGGDSWFNSTADVLAKGGGAGSFTNGTQASGGAAASGVGDVTFSGGNGGLTNTTVGPSAGGGGAGDANNGGNAGSAGSPGAGGVAGGGAGGDTNAFNGQDGSAPGGGGGGSTLNRISGAGGNGQVTITFTQVFTNASIFTILNGAVMTVLNGATLIIQ